MNRQARRARPRTIRRVEPAAPSGILDRLTDRFDDTLNISAAGHGHVLLEIVPADPDAQTASVELPETWIPRLFISAVKATGKSPDELLAAMQKGPRS